MAAAAGETDFSHRCFRKFSGMEEILNFKFRIVARGFSFGDRFFLKNNN